MAGPDLGCHSGYRILSLVQHRFLGGRWRDLHRPVVSRVSMSVFPGFPKLVRDVEFQVCEGRGGVTAGSLGRFAS